MGDCLIFCVFNDGVYELALNHLTSLRIQGIENYMAFTTGEKSHNLLKNKGFNVTLIANGEGHNENFDYSSDKFGMFSYIRYKIMLPLLERYKYLWYLDVDTVVLGDINGEIDRAAAWDLCIQDDIHMPCTGCMLFRSGFAAHKAIKQIWDLKSPVIHDQITLANLIRNKELSMVIVRLPIYKFMNGLLYFDDDEICKLDEISSKVRGSVKSEWNNLVPPIFVHANFMTGTDNKIAALKRHGLWFTDNAK
jgi:hypothetical protein